MSIVKEHYQPWLRQLADGKKGVRRRIEEDDANTYKATVLFSGRASVS